MTGHLQRDLALLKDRILGMGGRVEEAVDRAHRALVERRPDLAHKVIAEDRVIDEIELALAHALGGARGFLRIDIGLQHVEAALFHLADVLRHNLLGLGVKVAAHLHLAHPFFQPLLCFVQRQLGFAFRLLLILGTLRFTRLQERSA